MQQINLSWFSTPSKSFRRFNDYLPISSSPERHRDQDPLDEKSSSYASVGRRWRPIAAALVSVAVVVVFVSKTQGYRGTATGVRNRSEWWGLGEAEGWREAPGLMDVGRKGETSYNLGMTDRDGYFDQLTNFTRTLPIGLQSPLISALSSYTSDDRPYTDALVDYKTIYLTDKTVSAQTKQAEAQWSEINGPDGWKVDFFDDEKAEEWMKRTFADSDILWAWGYMDRGVLKADFIRYLLPLVQGGVYSDVDVRPYRPIQEWGTTDIEYLSLVETDGPKWRSNIGAYPSVIIGVEVDVHQYPNWSDLYPRPFCICQWTLGSSPSHPIFLDTARRVVNATRLVQDWEEWRAAEVNNMRAIGREATAVELEGRVRGEVMKVLDWTGPGQFTDAVLAYLLARYNVTWHRLRDLDHPLRIGDVLILPVTAFSPRGEPDFKGGYYWEPQGAVVHECEYRTSASIGVKRGMKMSGGGREGRRVGSGRGGPS